MGEAKDRDVGPGRCPGYGNRPVKQDAAVIEGIRQGYSVRMYRSNDIGARGKVLRRTYAAQEKQAEK